MSTNSSIPADYSETVGQLQQIIPTSNFQYINLDDIFVAKEDNIRHHTSYTEEDVLEMADEIVSVGGLMQPIGVYPINPDPETGNKKFALAYGFRRTLALQHLAETDPERWGTNIPAMVMPGIQDKAQLTMVQLGENLFRKDISPLEKSQAIKLALDTEIEPGKFLSQKDIGKMLRLSESAVSQHLKMLDLPEQFQLALHDGRLPLSNARALVYSKLPVDKYNDLFKEALSDERDEFADKVKQLERTYGGTEETGDGDDKEGGAAKPKKKTASQRSRQTLRADDIQDDYIPCLEEQLKKLEAEHLEPKYTEADIVRARIDALKTVTLEGETETKKVVQPFIDAKKKAEEAEEAKEKAEKAETKFWKEKVKDVEALLNAPVDPTDLEAKRMTPGEAYATVVKRIYALQGEGKLGEIGFTLPEDKKVALKHLMETYAAVIKDRKEKADKAKKAKADKAAADKKDGENKPAEGEAAKPAEGEAQGEAK